MQNIIIGVVVFVIILFFYLHINYHLKTSNDLEIYEVFQVSKDRLEELCDFRQPLLLDFSTFELGDAIVQGTSKQFLQENYPIFSVSNGVQIKALDVDDASAYFVENNEEFLTETGIIKTMTNNDEMLRPKFVSNCYYDMLLASTEYETPLKYEINYRNYFMVTQGQAQLKLYPPSSSRYMHEQKDYELMLFSSPINPWSPQEKYQQEFEKVKCLEIYVTVGQLVFIPARWWYSFKFSEPNTSILSFKYRTYMNTIAICPHIAMCALQNQNIILTRTSTHATD